MDDIKSLKETDFYKKQHRVALRNCGVIDPENINEYIAYDGYAALAKCLSEYTPTQVIDIISESGLRAEAAAASPQVKSGASPQRRNRSKNTLSATPTRAIPARLWTVPCLRATRTA